MGKRSLTILLFIFCYSNVFCQPLPRVSIRFSPVFGNMPFELEKNNYPIGASDSIRFEALKFYISNLQLLDNNSIVYTEKNSFHLADASAPGSMLISLKNSSGVICNEIRFNLGIDSITNVSGAMGGDLDPARGMYWTWQSGYINCKMEGSGSASPARNHEFQFHLGGYQAPFNALQTIRLKLDKRDPVNIYLDVQKFFDVIDLSRLNHVMSPNTEAMDLSRSLAKCFYTR